MLKFLIVTSVAHKVINGKYYAYAPYVREMNLWIKKTDQVIILSPLNPSDSVDKIEISYTHPNIKFIQIPEINFTSIQHIILGVLKIPFILFKLFYGMLLATHIHLRCPGNTGLLGCFVQMAFPFKKKTAKYAGNWDPKSVQPLSYKLQQKILKNTWLTHHMKTLVYGEWEGSTKNILPFFTASYHESDKIETKPRTINSQNPINIIVVGSLEPGKGVLRGFELSRALQAIGVLHQLNYYGNGSLKKQLLERIAAHHMQHSIVLHGNIDENELKSVYQNAHFLLLLSDSEGWPKVVAEAMWWGCIPIATSVSCIPYMLNNGQNGVIASGSDETIINAIQSLVKDTNKYQNMSVNAMKWARTFTLEKFEVEINQLL